MAAAKNEMERILQRSGKEITKERSARVSSSVEGSYANKRHTLQQEIHNMEDELEQMLDLSASNRTTVDNRLLNFKGEEFVAKRHELRLSIALKQSELDLMDEDIAFLFNSNKKVTKETKEE